MENDKDDDSTPKKQGFLDKISRILSPWQIILAAACIGGLAYFIFVKKIVTFTEGLIVFGTLTLIIIIFVKREESYIGLIDVRDAQKTILNYAYELQSFGSIPTGQIEILPDCNIKRKQDRPRTIYVGIRVTTDGFDREYIGKVHPENGRILGLWYAPEGVQMALINDVTIIKTKSEELRKEGYDVPRY